MPLADADYRAGDFVQRRNEPESVGVIREARWDEQVESWNYLVQFGAQLKAVPQESLEPLTPVETPWDALESGRVSGLRHFIFSLTFRRLKNPPARIARSFATARTQFYPFQFKPLLKFLDNPGKRLLIADDVGLGKTIEAAYILRELDAHQAIERVLILVPSRLKRKWQQELRTRFGEYFDIVKGNDLAAYANDIGRGREPEPFKWIASLESSRSDEVRAAIDNNPLSIDILVVDEAHRLRNPDTQQYRAGAALSRVSDAIMFLTATPVQNKLEDLWTLLRLLSPEEFAEFPVFQSQIKSNTYILRAQKALSQHPPEVKEAERCLKTFFNYYSATSLQQSTFATSILDRMRSPSGDLRSRIELQSDIGRLSPTGHIISRTRKVEAIPNRPKRYPVWKKIRLTEPEREIYDHVEDICRQFLPLSTSSWGFQMALLTAYRMTASCIPAALAYFREKLSESEPFDVSPKNEVEMLDENEPEVDDYKLWSGQVRPLLSQLVDVDHPQVDSKFNDFKKALETIWDEDDKGMGSPRKVVVFSFFRKTLEYLSRSLTDKHINNRYIHGGVDVDQREKSISDFLEDPDIRVLLTSEVGGEGIDLQKASVLFNYDLPWNPMVVEQRIGRIDRIGQEATRLVIVNFVVENSIEERVLQRLLTKIDIFTESIGEPDPIIGEEIEKLTADALRGHLDKVEFDRRVEQEGDALARRVHGAKEMLSRVDGLLATDQVLIDEINSIIGERQLPSERELIVFLNSFLEKNFPGTQIPERATEDLVTVHWAGRLGVALEQAAADLGHDTAVFGRKISTGPVPITLSREVGFRHPRAELIHLQHPLTQFAVRATVESRESTPSAFALRLQSKRLGPGRYFFLVALVNIGGSRPSTRIVPIFCSAAGDRVLSDTETTLPILVEMLESAEDFIRVPNIGLISAAKSALLSALEQLKRDWEARERKLDAARSEQQTLARSTIADFRIRRLHERIARYEQNQMSEAVLRMARGQLAKAEREREVALAPFGATRQWQIEHEEVAVGLLQIEG